jgi:hypothetical protein
MAKAMMSASTMPEMMVPVMDFNGFIVTAPRNNGFCFSYVTVGIADQISQDCEAYGTLWLNAISR